MEKSVEINKTIFGNSDINSIISKKKDFSEADVRAIVIDPIIKALGFSSENVERDKTLVFRAGHKTHNIRPDYLLKIGNSYAWVIDAKSPTQNIFDTNNIEQAHSYASHINVNSNYFALCNGLEFALYKTTESSSPKLYFKIKEIDQHWQNLEKTLSINSFQSGKTFTYDTVKLPARSVQFEYAKRPLLAEIPVKKQAVKRHFGVHGYFTKQTWNVVAEYIKNYTQEGDVVLDPFGGSGVTAIEAVMNNRKGINIDLNPMAVFLVNSLAAPVKASELADAFESVKNEYLKQEPKTTKGIETILKKYKGPKSIILPKSSDVETTDQLFSKKQTAQLALLKSIIMKQKNTNIRDSLLLMFSGMVSRNNLTFHGTRTRSKDVDGLPSVFRYSRYRIAPNNTEIDFIKIFNLRFKKILAAKREMQYFINEKTIENLKIYKGTATDLSFLNNESVDYIYTDPPYGKNIAYLDLSAMWTAWMDWDVTEQDYEDEAIEGGERRKSKEKYKSLIAQSIKEMYRVLKYDRWLSFVFAHKDPEYWHMIIDSCENCGFEYMGAVSQKNGKSHFKKHQHPFNVLSGMLILNFRKTRSPKSLLRANLGSDVEEMIMKTIEGVIAKNYGATLEEINDELIIKGLEGGFLHLLKKHYSNLTPLLLDRFDYSHETEKFNIKKNKPFVTKVDEKLRISYFLESFLFKAGVADFDTIIYEIMPLLKNGRTPEDQTIESVLKDLAEKTEKGWRLKPKENLLFEFV